MTDQPDPPSAVVDLRQPRKLGSTGLEVSRLGLAAGYKVPKLAVERAFHEFGINYFHWDVRKPGMERALGHLARTERDRIAIGIQTYDHTGYFLEWSVERALRRLPTNHVDLLVLGWFNRMPGKRVLAEAQRLKRKGVVRFLAMSGHNRSFHGKLAADPCSPIDVHQVRYNAAHRGAEEDIFPHLRGARPPGILTYTATRWGKLLQEKRMPRGERPMTAAECYRFVLTDPHVDVCLMGPRNEREMLEGVAALEQGPLSEQELERVRRIGDHVHG